jgi:4'-phosphopantetheinyl transferase
VPDVVNVWFLEGPAPSPPPESWLRALDPEERARADAFRTPELRARFVGAHALLRTVLSSHAPLAPGEWRVTPGPEGRPRLEDPPVDLRFSLSHSAAHAAVALAVGRDVGIDLEEIDPAVDALGIAGRFFTGPERETLVACGGMERPRRFTTLWTIKEAVLKARGLGLGAGLKTVEVSLDAQGRLTSVVAPGGPWTGVSWEPVPGLRAAVAVQASSRPALRVFRSSPLGPSAEAPELSPEG